MNSERSKDDLTKEDLARILKHEVTELKKVHERLEALVRELRETQLVEGENQ